MPQSQEQPAFSRPNLRRLVELAVEAQEDHDLPEPARIGAFLGKVEAEDITHKGSPEWGEAKKLFSDLSDDPQHVIQLCAGQGVTLSANVRWALQSRPNFSAPLGGDMEYLVGAMAPELVSMLQRTNVGIEFYSHNPQTGAYTQKPYTAVLDSRTLLDEGDDHRLGEGYPLYVPSSDGRIEAARIGWDEAEKAIVFRRKMNTSLYPTFERGQQVPPSDADEVVLLRASEELTGEKKVRVGFGELVDYKELSGEEKKSPQFILSFHAIPK